MSFLLRILPYLRKMAFFEFIEGFRAKAAGSIAMYIGIVGIVYGQVPVINGGEIVWVPLSPELAIASFTGGLALLGIRGAMK